MRERHHSGDVHSHWASRDNGALAVLLVSVNEAHTERPVMDRSVPLTLEIC